MMGSAHSRQPPAVATKPKSSGGPQSGPGRSNTEAQTGLQAEAGRAPEAQAEGGVGGTLAGWFGGASDWMGKKYDQVSGAVSSGWNSVKKTAGDFRDIYKNTDLGWEDGKISASTDADEVLDVLPADLRKQLQLDKSDPAANKVSLEMDTNTGVLSLKIPNLQLNSLSMGGLTAGKTSLTGLTATLTNADGLARSMVEKKAGSRVAGWVFGKDRQAEGAKSLDSSTSLRVSHVHAADVALPGSNIAAKELDLMGLSVLIANKGGGLPGLDATPDRLSANFNVASAVVRGLKAPDMEANELSASGVGMNIDQDSESGSLSARRLGASGLSVAGQQLGSGEVEGLKSRFTNQGGGLPMLDQKADKLALAEASMDRAKVSNLNGKAAGLASGELRNVAYGDKDGKRTMSVGGIDIERLRTAKFSAAKLHGTGIAGESSKVGGRLSATSLGGTGLDAAGQKVAAADIKGLDAQVSGAGGMPGLGGTYTGTQGKVDSVNVSGIDSTSVDAERASITNGSWSHDQQGSNVKLGGVQASGVTGDNLKVNEASAQNLQVRNTQGNTKASADRVAGRGVQVDQSGARTLDGEGLSAEFGNGVSAANVDRLNTTGLVVPHVTADQASVQGLGVRTDKTGLQVGVTGVQGQNITAPGVQTDRLTGSGVSVGVANGDTSVKVQQLGAAGLRAGDNKVGQLDVGALNVGVGSGKTQVGADSLTASNIDTASIDAKSLSAKHAAWNQSSAGMSGSVGQADARGVSGLATADQLSVTGARGTKTADGMTADIEALTGKKLGYGANSVATADVKGVGIQQNAGGIRANIASAKATGVDTANVDASTVTGTGLSAKSSGGNTEIGVQQLGATGVALDGGAHQAQVKDVAVRNAQAKMGGGMSGSVGQASLSGVQYQGQLPGTGVTPTAPVQKGGQQDMANIADLSRVSAQGNVSLKSGTVGLGGGSPGQYADLVQDLDATARVPLRPGDYGSVEVDKGTHVDARTQVRDGKVVPKNTRADVNNPLDAPLWVTANGAYLDSDKKRPDQMKLRADLGGAPDINVSDKLPGGKDQLPTDLGDLVSQVAPRPAQSTGKSAGSVTLAREQQTDNNVGFSANGADNLVLTFTRLLVSSLNVNAGGTQVQAGKSAASGASVQVDAGGKDTNITGSVGKIDVQDLKVAR